MIRRPNQYIDSVAEFVEFVMGWKYEDKAPTAFRGQSFFGWPTIPKIFRDSVGLYEKENLAVRDIVSVHPSEFESDRTMFDRLVRMQHFGLPTRLLDVTINPLVALWFATANSVKEESDGTVQAFYVPESRQRYYDSDRVSCLSNLANLKLKDKDAIFRFINDGIKKEEFNQQEEVDRLLYHIGMEKPHFRPIINPDDLLRPVYVKPKMANKRIIAQSGAFLLYGAKHSKRKGNEKGVKINRVGIKEDDKSKIRMELQKLGVNESTLFPEIDRTARFITDMHSVF
ncbi:FRG domain-containing protein [Pectobacterium punjabense]|uniref:FRG domain-containing protein n=1 Tax=Pectobacterium punjabense TaxID=2108399 RepID=UPI003817E2A9